MVLMVRFSVFVALCCSYSTLAQDPDTPFVDFISCLSQVIHMVVLNSRSGGLMYIRNAKGQYSNVQPTVDGTVNYTCPFDVCDVEYGELFLFVIQRNLAIQTTHDIHLTYYCIADLAAIIPNDATNQDLDESDIQQYVYSADVEMKFFSAGNQVSQGQYIKLGTIIDMTLDVTNNVEEFFDIKAKSCTASSIQLIESKCPVDSELFDAFNKTGAGMLRTTFEMFRPTSPYVGPVEVMFTCTVEVCRDPCSPVNCTDSDVMSGRKKRASDDSVLKTQTVGTMFSVGTEDYVPDIVQDGTCVNKVVLIICSSVASFLLTLCLSSIVYFGREWRAVVMATCKQLDKNTKENEDKKVFTDDQHVSLRTKSTITLEKEENASAKRIVVYDNNAMNDSTIESGSEDGFTRNSLHQNTGTSTVRKTEGAIFSGVVDTTKAREMDMRNGVGSAAMAPTNKLMKEMRNNVLQKLEAWSTADLIDIQSPHSSPRLDEFKQSTKRKASKKRAGDQIFSSQTDISWRQNSLNKVEDHHHNAVLKSADFVDIGSNSDMPTNMRDSRKANRSHNNKHASAGQQPSSENLPVTDNSSNISIVIDHTQMKASAVDRDRLERFKTSLAYSLRRRSSLIKTPSMEHLITSDQ